MQEDKSDAARSSPPSSAAQRHGLSKNKKKKARSKSAVDEPPGVAFVPHPTQRARTKRRAFPSDKFRSSRRRPRSATQRRGEEEEKAEIDVDHDIEEQQQPTTINNANSSQRQTPLVEATLVEADDEEGNEDITKEIILAVPASKRCVDTSTQGGKWLCFGLAGLLACVVIAIVAIVVVSASGTLVDIDTNNTAMPTAAITTMPPTIAPTAKLDLSTHQLPDLALPQTSLEPYTLIAMQDPDSPQYQANAWLLYHPLLQDNNMPLWKKEQLFALSTLYYSFYGSNNIDTDDGAWLDYSIDECQWTNKTGNYFQHACQDGHLRNLYIGDYQGLQESQRAKMPPEIAMLSSLQFLIVKHTNWDVTFQEALPLSLVQMSSLKRLHYESNLLHGTIPDYIDGLTQLSWLRFNGNQLTSSLPSTLGLLTNLNLFYPSSNLIDGHLPSELGRLHNLTKFRANNNRLSGTLFSEIGLLTKLVMLTLFENTISGPLVTELGHLAKLTTLSLYGNRFSSTIPTELQYLTSVKQLWLNSNQFSGSVPSELGLLTVLTGLSLHNNNLRGEMPTEVCALSNLELLRVDCAKISCPDLCVCVCCGMNAC